MNKFLAILIGTVINISFTYPVFGQDIIIKTIENDISYNTREFDFYNESRIFYSITNNVNIRRFPNTDSEILGFLLCNEKVEVFAQYEEWYCIKINENIAFVYTDYLRDSEIPKMMYTQEELDILAHILAGECQALSDMEQLRVGSVVLNRIKDSRYPNTMQEVVFQKNQYACVKNGNYYREPTERNWENAKWLLEYGSVLPEYVIYQSKTKQGSNVYLKTKYHYYCY